MSQTTAGRTRDQTDEDIPAVPRQRPPQVPEDDVPELPDERLPDVAERDIPKPPDPALPPVGPPSDHAKRALDARRRRA